LFSRRRETRFFQPVIITHLMGGLGNQMFQYAAGLALAEHRRTVLKLDPRWFRHYPDYEAHNRYALSCFNITEQFATEEEIGRVCGLPLGRRERWAAQLARGLRHLGEGRRHKAERFEFYPGFFELADHTYLEGMWQSERFFEPVADLVRRHFTPRYPALPAALEMAARIRDGGPSAFVHFRRGDYASQPDHRRALGVIDLAYYRRAVALLLERQPGITLYVFSDDVAAVAREFAPPCPHVFVRLASPCQPHDELHLMSLCQHAIVANSTFSWWAAWLNASPAKTVIAPDPWFADHLDDRDVAPKSWLRLERSKG
jgi:Glycosyl transferase family 11